MGALDSTPNEYDKPLVMLRCAELAIRMPGGAEDLDVRELLTEAARGFERSGRDMMLVLALELSSFLTDSAGRS